MQPWWKNCSQDWPTLAHGLASINSTGLILKFCLSLLSRCWPFGKRFCWESITGTLFLEGKTFISTMIWVFSSPWTQDMLEGLNFLITWRHCSDLSPWWCPTTPSLPRSCFSHKDLHRQRSWVKKWLNCINYQVSSCQSKITMISVWERLKVF